MWISRIDHILGAYGGHLEQPREVQVIVWFLLCVVLVALAASAGRSTFCRVRGEPSEAASRLISKWVAATGALALLYWGARDLDWL